MNAYLFYDLETTGLNKAFDQVIQFAAIRTDSHFHERERSHIRLRLRPDVIPSPGAMLTHGIPMTQLLSGETEYSAVARIHQLFNTPGTVSIGYNNLGFDDEFLRFAFYRNLLPPYTHQYANGCMRMDLLPMATVFRLFRPELITWPEIDGKPTLKLEHISAANGLAEGPAHDAMVDVEATLALAKRLAADSEVWHWLAGAFIKSKDVERIDNLPVAIQAEPDPFRLGLLVGSEFGADADFLAPVLGIGKSTAYANQTLWLRLDRPELSDTTGDTVAETTWVIRKKPGEPAILLPPLPRYWQRLDPDRARLVTENRDWLDSHPAERAAIVNYHRTYRYPDVPNVDPDAALYREGFMPAADERICAEFHAADFAGKIALIDRFSRPSSAELARRILYRNFPDRLPPVLSSLAGQHRARINPAASADAPVDYRGAPRLTPSAALAEVDAYAAEPLTPNQRRRLSELVDYIREHFPDTPHP